MDSILDGFCVWFEMSLDDDIVLSTDPLNTSIVEQPSCWESAIFRLKHRFTNSQKLQNLNVTVSAGIYAPLIQHEYFINSWESTLFIIQISIYSNV